MSPSLLQIGADLGIVQRGIVTKVECLHVRQECSKRSGILCVSGREFEHYRV